MKQYRFEFKCVECDHPCWYIYESDDQNYETPPDGFCQWDAPQARWDICDEKEFKGGEKRLIELI